MDQICNTLIFVPKERRSYGDTFASVVYLTVDDLYSGNASPIRTTSYDALPGHADTIAAQNNNATCAGDMLKLLRIPFSTHCYSKSRILPWNTFAVDHAILPWQYPHPVL